MNKFLAVVKREYVQRVRSKMFVLMTVLAPVMLIVFAVLPHLLFSIKAGGDTRVAIVDQTENARLYERIRESLLTQENSNENPGRNQLADTANSSSKERLEAAGRSMTARFSVEPVTLNGLSLAEVRHELNDRIGIDQLDGYLVIPSDILKNGDSKASYYGRNVSDVITRGQIEERLDRAVRKQRLVERGIREQDIENLSRPVRLATYPVNEKGEEGIKDSGAGFALVFVIAFLIYLTVLLYGQVILGAVIEEKESRIAEILLSSVRSFTLMFGKLIGVSLVALTQMSIWVLAFVLVSLYGLTRMTGRGLEEVSLPQLPPIFFLYFFLFFVVGYFIYATIYLLIGSVVTTAQEGGQLAMPVVMLLLSALYIAFPVIRSPNSPFAVWVSMFPFFAPITMIVRIVSQTPPTWQIILSLVIAAATAWLLLWLASRIYRVGMLMYGKKASIPQVWRWLRQA